MEPTQKEGSVQVTRTLLEYGQEVKEKEKRKKIVAKLFATDPAHVGVNKSLTLNLGNYQSLRVGVSITVPCYTEEAYEVFLQADEMADKMLEHAMSNAASIRDELDSEGNDDDE